MTQPPAGERGRHVVLDIISAVLIFLGAVLSLAAAVGLVRFGDLLSRMHAGTKPQVFGLLLLLTAVALKSGEPRMVPMLVLAWIFQLLTVPVSAHMVGRAAYRSKHLHEENLVTDELRDVVARVGEDSG